MNNSSVERGKHPGWSVWFKDSTWLGGAHGWFRSEDAFYADIYASEDAAKGAFAMYKKDLLRIDEEEASLIKTAMIVPAWEPLCEKLRLEVTELKRVNRISPDNIFEITLSIENLLADLKRITK